MLPNDFRHANCCRQESVLGTGEFGDVFKGVWETPYGPQDVAMKMLKSGSNEKDKINFLKEAALMGQFRHPHVIRLLGTVTVVVPVSKWLCIVYHVACITFLTIIVHSQCVVHITVYSA